MAKNPVNAKKIKSKPTKKREQKEQAAQILVVEWFARRYPELDLIFFHIPNGVHVGAFRGKMLKKQGVKAGIPDLFLSVPKFCEDSGEIYHGLYIEMKAQDGKVRPHQKKTHELLRDKNYMVEVCYSFTQARIVINRYLS